MNEQTERVSLISRLMCTGVFKANDKHAMRTMSLNTLRELTRAVRGDRLPEARPIKLNVVPNDDARGMLPPSLGDILRRR
jgi:hypothetical protein